MNYTQLKTAIQDYTQSSESSFVTNIDTFIAQAENRLFFDIDVPDFHKNVTGTMTQSNTCLLYTSPSPRDGLLSRMPSSA